MPPIQPAVRTIYPKLVNSKQLTPLFSLDASAQEIIWVVGPVVATFVAIQVSSVAGILLAAAFLVGGGVWFVSLPEVGRVRIPRSKRKIGAVLKRPAVLLSTIVGFVLVAACARSRRASSPHSATAAATPVWCWRSSPSVPSSAASRSGTRRSARGR